MKKIPTLFVRDFEGTLGPAGRYVLPVDQIMAGFDRGDFDAKLARMGIRRETP